MFGLAGAEANALLEGTLPRCLFASDAFTQNTAFAALANSDKERAVALGRSVLAGASTAAFADIGAFRFTAVHVSHEATRCVLLCAVPLASHRDSRMHSLPKLFRFAGGAMPNSSNLHQLMNELMAADPQLFRSCVLYVSRGGASFVPLHDVARDADEHFVPARWPFERICAARRGTIVHDRSGTITALALPLFAPPLERYVVVAIIGKATLDQSDEDFLSTLRSVPAGVARIAAVSHDIRSKSSIDSLRIAYYGRADVDPRIARAASAWDWDVYAAPSLQALFERAPADIVIVDVEALPHGESTLSAIRLAMPRAALVSMASRSVATFANAVDDVIDASADDAEVRRVLKLVARRAQLLLNERFDTEVDRQIATILPFAGVEALCALTALAIEQTMGGGWVSVHVVDDAGTIHHAEAPPEYALLQELPDYFLSGRPIFKAQFDETFFDEIGVDEDVREHLRSLQAASAIALPLLDEGHLAGAVVALSKQPLDERHFGAVSKIAIGAGDLLRDATSRASSANATWRRVTQESVDVDAFSANAAGSAASVFADASSIFIEMRGPGEAYFSGVIGAKDAALSFRDNSMADPLIVNAHGPVAALRSKTQRNRVTIPPGSIAAIFPRVVYDTLDANEAAADLQDAIRNGKPAADTVLARAARERELPLVFIASREA